MTKNCVVLFVALSLAASPTFAAETKRGWPDPNDKMIALPDWLNPYSYENICAGTDWPGYCEWYTTNHCYSGKDGKTECKGDAK
jgi:hypothetical protein